MKRFVYTIPILIVGLALAFLLHSGSASAQSTTVDEAITAVNDAYAGQGITDRDVRDNLLLILNDAKYAPTPDDYAALVSSFKILVNAQRGTAIVQTIADNLVNLADGL